MIQQMTQLESVNTILGTIGEAPINTLTGTLPQSASVALNTLNEFIRDVQTDGFWFNCDTNVTLTPDALGNYLLAANVAKVEIEPKRYAGMELIMRPTINGQNQIYDRRNQTYQLTTISNLVVDRITYWLDWTQLPQSARKFITIRAARVFADRWVGAETVHQFTQQDELDAKRAMMANAVDEGEYNILSSPSTAQGLYRGGFGALRF